MKEEWAVLRFEPHVAFLEGGALKYEIVQNVLCYMLLWGHAVVQLVEALCYKPEGHGFDSRWCHRNFSLT